jgi:DNA-binding transcriptional MerR regulator
MSDRMSSAHVARMADVTYRQLDYWVRRGFLEPTHADAGSGTPREWSPADALRAVLIARLVRAGMTVHGAVTVAQGARWDETSGKLDAPLTDGLRLTGHFRP